MSSNKNRNNLKSDVGEKKYEKNYQQMQEIM